MRPKELNREDAKECKILRVYFSPPLSYFASSRFNLLVWRNSLYGFDNG
jgi:hypothetical protein